MLFPVVLACSGGGSGLSGDGGVGDAEPAASQMSCAADPRVAQYSPNLTIASAGETFTLLLVDATPAPPAVGSNSWVIHLTDSTGAPMTSAALAASTFMPDHGHGQSVPVLVSSGGDGSYQITDIDLFMPGVWRITLARTSPEGGIGDDVELFFCVGG